MADALLFFVPVFIGTIMAYMKRRISIFFISVGFGAILLDIFSYHSFILSVAAIVLIGAAENSKKK